jgi:catecholate siderophore receptor
VRDIGAQSRDVFAVDQIEVVKGSDSTMNGRGSVGGAINLVSKQPTASASPTSRPQPAPQNTAA